MKHYYYLAAAFFFIVGMGIRYWRGRRRFYRRNKAGMQVFINYHRSLLMIWLESCALFLSALCLFLALLFLVLGYLYQVGMHL